MRKYRITTPENTYHCDVETDNEGKYNKQIKIDE